MKKIRLLIIILIIVSSFSSIYAEEELMTKSDFKLFVEMINKRFDDVNKRFDDVNKRFDIILWIMGIAFTSLASFSFILSKNLEKQMNRRFEQVDRRFEAINERFEQVDMLLLLLVKAHKDVLGDKVLDVTMGHIKLKDMTDEMTEDINKKIIEDKNKMVEEVMYKIEPFIIEKVEKVLASHNII